VVHLPERNLVLQAGGVDRKLPGLVALVNRPGSQLIVHRPERRGVVRLSAPVDEAHGASAPVRYGKVVRPRQTAALATAMRQIHEQTGGHFQTPLVLSADEATGTIVLSALPGRPLRDWYGSKHLPDLAFRAGSALATLHSLPVSEDLTAHAAAEEIGVLKKWFSRMGTIAPDLPQRWAAHLERVCGELARSSAPPVLLHRDFYDRQVLFDLDSPSPNGSAIGILDFDTLAYGEAALDVANALVHFELRSLQRQCTPSQANAAQEAFLAGYRPSAEVRARLPVYADATRLRLACVYACRPAQAFMGDPLIKRLGAPIPAS
jgi:aminoglycoside phosphotransferase (APT) family kinase protein